MQTKHLGSDPQPTKATSYIKITKPPKPNQTTQTNINHTQQSLKQNTTTNITNQIKVNNIKSPNQ